MVGVAGSLHHKGERKTHLKTRKNMRIVSFTLRRQPNFESASLFNGQVRSAHERISVLQRAARASEAAHSSSIAGLKSELELAQAAAAAVATQMTEMENELSAVNK